MYRFIREMREKKPLFTLDFQNDGEFVGELAGGRTLPTYQRGGRRRAVVFIHYPMPIFTTYAYSTHFALPSL